jgi:ActR/RegA family two-component response regulator
MTKPTLLTLTDWQTMRRALNDAMNDRASYADTWVTDAPEAIQARQQVATYETLHVKLFGEASARQMQIERFATMPTISITEMINPGQDDSDV